MKLEIRSKLGVALATLMVLQFNPKPLLATVLPANYAMPAGTVNTNQPGFTVRPYQTDTAGLGTIAWNQGQQDGNYGPNIADLSGANPSGYYTVSTVVNWSSSGAAVDGFPASDLPPGIPGTTLSANNFSEQVLTYIEFPAAGTYILGVNSDDGFGVTASVLNPKSQSTAITLGAFDGNRGSGDTLFTVDVAQAGIYPFRVLYWNSTGGDNLAWFRVITNSSSTNLVLINDLSTPGALKAYATASIAPPYATSFNSSPAGFSFVIQDDISALAPGSLQVQLNGTPVTVTTSKVGSATTVSYSAPAPYFAPGSSNVVSAQFSDNAVPAHNLTAVFSFLVQSYTILTPSLKVAADTSKPGFKWNVFANKANTTASNARTEAALAGQLVDVDGVTPLPNNANPTAQGAAIAIASAPSPANAPIKFEIAGPLNLDVAATVGVTNGNFYPDGQMPGLPATDASNDGVAAEAITYISLPAGLVTMGVNSDGGFRTTVGLVPQDVVGSIQVAEFNGARSSADSLFYFLVQEAGVYAFRTSWENSTVTGNLEWFTLSGANKVLVNDTAHGGLAAYRALTTPIPPYVKYVSPEPVPRVLNQSTRSLQVVLADGTTALDDNSIILKLDGNVITPTKVRTGSQVTLTYTPNTLQFPGDQHLAELTFSGVGGTFTTTERWSFFNLLNIVLPAPVLTENFDSSTEGSVPTGWTAWNFTDCSSTFCAAPGLDLDNLNSDTYKDWVVVDGTRLTGLKSRIFQVAPGQTVNGVEVTVETLTSGNLLYAETDVRDDNQVQFLTTKAFNLAAVTNPAISFCSLYEQNQDNMNAVEYSVDGGTSWLPVVYYIDQQSDGGDIRFNADGSVDAVKTFTAPNADTAAWIDAGIPKGDNYGDGIAAPISPALGRFIYPRINDNSIEGKRFEIFRLPSASHKSDVRLRFAQLGTGSWYMGVDNIAFYDVAAPPVSKLTLAASGGSASFYWSGTGTLQVAPSVNGPWTVAPSQANPQTLPIGSGASFWRIGPP